MLSRIIKSGILDSKSSKQDGFGELLSLGEKYACLKTDLFRKSFEMLQGLYETVPKIISGIENVSGSLAAVWKCQKQLEGKVDRLGASVRALSDETVGISAKVGITENNLNQTRLLVERVADRVENLSREFIDRHVIEPVLKDFGSLYNVLSNMKQIDDEGVNDLLEQFRVILESNDTEVIEPKRGTLFNALEHQPLKKVVTNIPRRDKSVSSTVRAGFKLKGRVIQKAQVDVYTFRKASETLNQKEVSHESVNA